MKGYTEQKYELINYIKNKGKTTFYYQGMCVIS